MVTNLEVKRINMVKDRLGLVWKSQAINVEENNTN